VPQVPKFDPARRNARTGPLSLPAKGREGEPPAWPLSTCASEAERDAWWQLWSTPQAVAWERLGWTRTVARYCRIMVACEQPDAAATLHAQATALEDRLGLTPKAMRLLLWQIAADEVAEQREKPKSARGRIRAVG
jgi:hypothetical protein